MSNARVWAVAAALLAAACGPASRVPAEASRSARVPETVVAEVEALAAAIAADLQARGPLAWMDHFDSGPEFFMASDGVIAFADIDAAADFLADFAPTITQIQLQWSELMVSVLSADLATLAAGYTESMRDTQGAERRFEGYFTATAVRTAAGWKLRNLHWSSPRQPETMQ